MMTLPPRPSPSSPMREPTLTDIRHALEAAFPAWHVWMSEGGHPYAVSVQHGCVPGMAVTLECAGIGLMAWTIADYEHKRDRRLARGAES